MTVKQVAEAATLDAPAATVAVNDLESRGLVSRRSIRENRRCKLVSLTDAGRKVVAILDEIEDPAPPALARSVARTWPRCTGSSPESSAGRRSAQIALDLASPVAPGLPRVAAGLHQRPPLTQQVPALIQLGLDEAQPLVFLGGSRSPCCTRSRSFTLLGDEVVDARASIAIVGLALFCHFTSVPDPAGHDVAVSAASSSVQKSSPYRRARTPAAGESSARCRRAHTPTATLGARAWR